MPLTEENETAMEDEVFLSFLTKLGLAAPANEQVSRLCTIFTQPASVAQMCVGLVTRSWV